VRRTELLIFLRPLLIDEPTLQGDYASYATHLPDDEFLTSVPSPGQRNFPHMPLRPLLLPAATGPAVRPDASLSSTERLP
jgi:general secretion pathway protein D